MPLLDFSFSGNAIGVEITTAFDKEGNTVDVSRLTVWELADKLNSGELHVPIHDLLSNYIECNAKVVDFTACRYRDRKDG